MRLVAVASWSSVCGSISSDLIGECPSQNRLPPGSAVTREAVGVPTHSATTERLGAVDVRLGAKGEKDL